jgi:hypothetical protein
LTPRTVENRDRYIDGAQLDQFGRRGVVMPPSIGAVRPGRSGQPLARRRRATRAAFSVATPVNPAVARPFGVVILAPYSCEAASVQSRHTSGAGLQIAGSTTGRLTVLSARRVLDFSSSEF